MPDTPNASRVEEVLARIKGVKHNVGTEPRTYYLAEQADLDAFAAAVQRETIQRVRERVEASARWTINVDGVSMVTEPCGNWLARDEVLAALADLAEGK